VINFINLRGYKFFNRQTGDEVELISVGKGNLGMAGTFLTYKDKWGEFKVAQDVVFDNNFSLSREWDEATFTTLVFDEAVKDKKLVRKVLNTMISLGYKITEGEDKWLKD
jgi:hypothetical protein